MGRFSHLLLIIIGGILVASGLLWQNSTRPEKKVAGTTAEISQDTVLKVIDGDTFTLGNGKKVRLIGINAPESDQPYAKEAKEKLQSLNDGKEINIVTDVGKEDQYGRTLAYVSVGETNVNSEMLKSGLAVIETIPPNVSQQDSFVVAQQTARENCSGIWEGLCAKSESVCVQLSEIHAKSTTPEKNGEWVELINTCASPQNLAGYLLKDSSASNIYEFKNITLNSKKTIKLYSGCGEDSITSIYWQCPERGSYVWNDNTDRAYLYNNTGKLVSELGY